MKYDTDAYEWTVEQAALLRKRAANELDYDNLAEEIESLGKSDRREVLSRLEDLVLHLLKLRYQPKKRSPSWPGSVQEARNRLEDLLEQSPSLRPYTAECLPRAYVRARGKALRQTGLARLPETCPWAIDDVLSPDFWP
ncbi:MAG: DUF29 domain-containing protein [Hyphomicrobiales bacterium]|nr:DUF29 domain-containing protein [Hyphomicrobiales bacterium]